MGIGPAPATQKLLRHLGMTLEQFDVIELNEAFASRGLAVLRTLGLRDDDPARAIPTAARSRSAIRSAHGGARLITTALLPTATHAAAASRSARCASAWAKASHSSSKVL